MGAGQIGGMATLLDIDFNNAAGYVGVKSEVTEAQYVVYFLSHAMLFCMGALIEAHVVLTPASCVYGERFKFEVFGGTHRFLERAGISRTVEHMAIHRGFNHTMRWDSCSTDNVALLMVTEQFLLHSRQENTDYIMNRLRYGLVQKPGRRSHDQHICRFYGWGSRRNGYLIPLLIDLRRVDVTIFPSENCQKMWNYGDKYLCMTQFSCKTERHGALCPDDLGSVIECGGYLRGMMASRLIDRPCGVGFLDMDKYMKFVTCGVDDSRDILGHDDFREFEFGQTTVKTPKYHVNSVKVESEALVEENDGDPGPPTTHSTVSGEEETTLGMSDDQQQHVPQEQQILQEQIVPQELQEQLVPQEHQEQLVPQEHQEQLVPQEHQEPQGLPGEPQNPLNSAATNVRHSHKGRKGKRHEPKEDHTM